MHLYLKQIEVNKHMVTIKVMFGTNAPLNRSFATPPTVGQVVSDSTVKAVLGYGDSVRTSVNGVEVSPSHQLMDNDSLRIETRCNEKANH